MDSKTIVGLATAVGNAGISVIRLSGSLCFEIANLVFKGKESVLQQKSHTVQYGKIVNPENEELVDEVLLTKMEAPRSYTRENVVEISCHGGYVSAGSIMNLLLSNGAKASEPGEFTKRAFLNGRLDLSQAEAVMDIIQSRTQTASKAALKQLEGQLSQKLVKLENDIIDMLASIEVNLDYPEHEAEEVTLNEILRTLYPVKDELLQLLKTYSYGKILKEGMEVVIVGKPNVGKSSLMNRLSRKNRSIVTDIPGTTRDIIEADCNIKGLPVRLTDTAGIRTTQDFIERLGVEKSLEALKRAHFILFVLNAQNHSEDEDVNLLNIVKESGIPFQLIINKIDLIDDYERNILTDKYPGAIFISVVNDLGIESLEDAIYKSAVQSNQDFDNQVLITNARHETLIKNAIALIDNAIAACKDNLTMDLLALELKQALIELGAITGRHVDDSIIQTIFSRFCLGK